MTAWSGRWSGGVTRPSGVSPGQAFDGTVKAPESMGTPGRGVSRSAEGRRRVSRAELEQLATRLSSRDRAVLHDIDRFGFLTSQQLEILHFDGHATTEAAARICRRVLARLRRDRLIEPLERRIGGLRAGSASYVWRLGPVGDRLLRLAEPAAPRARRKEPSLRFVEHRLGVASAVCALALASRSGLFELLDAEPEPRSWRRFDAGYGGPAILKPDLFVMTAQGAYEYQYFAEVDRATESVPTVLKQCEAYEAYRRSGREQAASGLFPRVIWLTPNEVRQQQLERAIQRRGDLDPELFQVVVAGQLVEHLVAAQEAGGEPDAGAAS